MDFSVADVVTEMEAAVFPCTKFVVRFKVGDGNEHVECDFSRRPHNSISLPPLHPQTFKLFLSNLC